MLMLAVSALTSCRGDDGPFNDQIALYDIVTFEHQDENGIKFSFQRRDDSPMIYLTVPGRRFVSDIDDNTRMLIGYYPEIGKAYTSSNITLLSASEINQDTLQIESMEEIAGWDRDAVYLNSVWRSGKYINMYMRVDYSDDKRMFHLSMDEATAGDEYPHLYLVHDLLDAPDSFTRRAYISIDISAIWSKESCRGIIIHINDDNLKQETYTFNK